MKNILLFTILMVVLTSCDPELNYFYSIENNGTDIVTVRSMVSFSDDTIASTIRVDPGQTVEFAEYHFIGTTENIESDDVYFDLLEITNSTEAAFKKDPLNAELWEKRAVNRNDGEWLLPIDDSDFE